ncbi:MAG: KR domain-containing protein [Actinomycetota bacterium]|nr:KR domain-containing protein [Actinomycetota bacterium]
MDLTNASAIVTGGAGGFGSATVRRLAQMGAKALTVRATRSPTSENSVRAKFGSAPARRASIISGSCAVTSRNTLLPNGATNATWSRCFGSEAGQLSSSGVPGAEIGGSLATVNFRESPFHALG